MQGAQYVFYDKKQDFLVAQEQKLGTSGHLLGYYCRS